MMFKLDALWRAALLAAVAGSRSMTPLAAVSVAAWRRALPRDNGAPSALAHPAVTIGSLALAAGELWGDKLESAPDRIVPAGLAARAVSGAVVGMSMAPRSHREIAAVGGAAIAIAMSFQTFTARMRAMQSHGQTSTGVVEDALVLLATIALVATARR